MPASSSPRYTPTSVSCPKRAKQSKKSIIVSARPLIPGRLQIPILMSVNSKLDRLRKRETELRVKLNEQLRNGKLLQANATMGKIKDVEAAIEEAENYLPKKLSELFDKETLNKSGINIAIVKVHLAADYLVDCAYDLKDKFDKLGVQGNHLLPLLDEIKKRAQEFASIVCHPNFAGLSDFIVNNEDYIDEVNTITDKYIEDHLTITDD